MDLLIFGIMGAVAIFAAIFIFIKMFKSKYTEGISSEDANRLINRFMLTYDNDKISLTDKSEQMDKIILDMRTHAQNNRIFVRDLNVDLPENVSSIHEKRRA